eukprot:9439627-Ditylum_brightwellii.AAC.1
MACKIKEPNAYLANNNYKGMLHEDKLQASLSHIDPVDPLAERTPAHQRDMTCCVMNWQSWR